MNTFQLECFLTVAETLNFAKAAHILNITQPAVTKKAEHATFQTLYQKC